MTLPDTNIYHESQCNVLPARDTWVDAHERRPEKLTYVRVRVVVTDDYNVASRTWDIRHGDVLWTMAFVIDDENRWYQYNVTLPRGFYVTHWVPNG